MGAGRKDRCCGAHRMSERRGKNGTAPIDQRKVPQYPQNDQQTDAKRQTQWKEPGEHARRVCHAMSCAAATTTTTTTTTTKSTGMTSRQHRAPQSGCGVAVPAGRLPYQPYISHHITSYHTMCVYIHIHMHTQSLTRTRRRRQAAFVLVVYAIIWC